MLQKLTLKPSLFLLFTLAFTLHSFSQSSIDSLRNIWQDSSLSDEIRFQTFGAYYKKYTYAKADTTLLVTDYHYALASEKNAIRQMARALNMKGNVSLYLSRRDTALSYFNKATKLVKQLNDPVFEATIQGNKGNVYLDKNEYQQATIFYTEALEIFREHQDKKGEGRMLNNLGGIYYTVGDYDLALEYYNKSLEIFNAQDNNARRLAILMLNIGDIQFKQSAYTEAIASHKKALDIFASQNEKVMEAVCYIDLAQSHLQLGELDQALVYGDKSLAINEAIEQEIQILKSQLIIAQITYETDVNTATQIGEDILNRLPPETSKETKSEVYELLYKCYKAQNKADASLKMFELYTTYNDSMQAEKNEISVIREAVKNDYNRQLYETELENKEEQTALKRKGLITTSLIVATAAVLLLCTILYFRSKNKKNYEKREALLSELEFHKSNTKSELVVDATNFKLDKERMEASINRKLNDTDWKVLNVLLEQPEITNKEMAEKVFLSVDGVGSSLRRMYTYFEIRDTKYKKIALLTEAIKRSK